MPATSSISKRLRKQQLQAYFTSKATTWPLSLGDWIDHVVASVGPDLFCSRPSDIRFGQFQHAFKSWKTGPVYEVLTAELDVCELQSFLDSLRELEDELTYGTFKVFWQRHKRDCRIQEIADQALDAVIEGQTILNRSRKTARAEDIAVELPVPKRPKTTHADSVNESPITGPAYEDHASSTYRDPLPNNQQETEMSNSKLGYSDTFEHISKGPASPLRSIVAQYQELRKIDSLPYHGVLLSGIPRKDRAGIFSNNHVECPPLSLQEDSPAMATLQALSPAAQEQLLQIIKRLLVRKGVEGIAAVAKAEGVLPQDFDDTAEDFERFALLANEMQKCQWSGSKLLMQGTERTSDIWIWRPFYGLIFMPKQGVTVYYGEVQTEASMNGAADRNVDWLVKAEFVGTSVGRHGTELGVGDSLGSLGFHTAEGRQKICKSARSARDMALALPHGQGNLPAVLWILQNHELCIVFRVRVVEANIVVAEYSPAKSAKAAKVFSPQFRRPTLALPTEAPRLSFGERIAIIDRQPMPEHSDISDDTDLPPEPANEIANVQGGNSRTYRSTLLAKLANYLGRQENLQYNGMQQIQGAIDLVLEQLISFVPGGTQTLIGVWLTEADGEGVLDRAVGMGLTFRASCLGGNLSFSESLHAVVEPRVQLILFIPGNSGRRGVFKVPNGALAGGAHIYKLHSGDAEERSLSVHKDKVVSRGGNQHKQLCSHRLQSPQGQQQQQQPSTTSSTPSTTNSTSNISSTVPHIDDTKPDPCFTTYSDAYKQPLMSNSRHPAAHHIVRSHSDPMLSMPRSAYPQSPSDYLPLHLASTNNSTSTNAASVMQRYGPLPPAPSSSSSSSTGQTGPGAYTGTFHDDREYIPSSVQHGMPYGGSGGGFHHHHPFSMSMPGLVGLDQQQHPHLHQHYHLAAAAAAAPHLHLHHQQQSQGYNPQLLGGQQHGFYYQPSPTGTGLPSLPTPVFGNFEDILGATDTYHRVRGFGEQQQQQQQQQERARQQGSSSHDGEDTSSRPTSTGGQQQDASLPTPPFSAPLSGGESDSSIPPPLANPLSPDSQHSDYTSLSYTYRDQEYYDDDMESAACSPQMGMGYLSGTVTPSSTWSVSTSPAGSVSASPSMSLRNLNLGGGAGTLSTVPFHLHQQHNSQHSKSLHQQQQPGQQPQQQQQQQQPGQPRIWRCFIPDCPKTYGTGAGLRYHLRHFHKMTTIPRQPPVRVARVKPDFYPCPKCGKQYGTAAGLRYHKKTFVHAEDGDDLSKRQRPNGGAHQQQGQYQGMATSQSGGSPTPSHSSPLGPASDHQTYASYSDDPNEELDDSLQVLQQLHDMHQHQNHQQQQPYSMTNASSFFSEF
ncbi:hypothetical protein HDU85_002890 [Gaertneriomyces sp. JEL0708]|nr:hypothetical protein HDU85_002890 [Gaertneriomyces sp. JEL0708]